MRIYNTLTRQVELFKSIHPSQVNIYVCGPTVYDFIHIGNARPVIFFDVVRRTFEYLGYHVNFVSNLTDIDDKIIDRAQELNVSEQELTQTFIKAFLNDVEKLGSSTKYDSPKVTDHIDDIIAYIDRCIKSEYAYEINGDVYFDVSKLKDYGALSQRNIDEQNQGQKNLTNDKKRNPHDFTLWKKTDQGLRFSSPWSEGRPGWHTECVALIDEKFGEKIDIHGGGSDLIFPHHENEMAQSKAVSNHHLANFWMHNGHLQVEDEKMSKSLGNMVFVKDIDVDFMGFRLFTLGTYYRAPLMYSEDALNTYVNEWDRLKRTYSQAFYALDLLEYLDETHKPYPEIEGLHDQFIDAMSDDFNTPNALTAMYSLVKILNQKLREDDTLEIILAAFKNLDIMFSILGLKVTLKRLTKDDRGMYHAWKDARRNKDFETADRLREKLNERGILA
jgi:cysteinyl-tRNA synthetase